MIALANGEQQVSILRAKGLSDARVLIARSEAQAVTIISEALQVTCFSFFSLLSFFSFFCGLFSMYILSYCEFHFCLSEIQH